MANEIELYQDPQAMEAVRLYTDPMLPTFGNKQASAAGAGCSVSIFLRKAVREEIERIIQQRQQASARVLEYLGTYTADAARELVRQLSTGRELEFVDPTKIFDEKEIVEELLQKANTLDDPNKIESVIAGLVAGRAKKAEAMIRHNSTVIAAAKERRASAIEILRQQIGTPEQRISVKHDNKPTPLDGMDDNALQELSMAISDELRQRQPQQVTVVEEVRDE